MELSLLWVRLLAFTACGLAVLLFAPHVIPAFRFQAVVQQAVRILGALWLVVALFCIWNSRADAALPPQLSPDGRYTARVIFGLPFSPLRTIVALHKTGSLHSEIVYSGDGWTPGGGEGSPAAEWQDDTHLNIRIHGPQAALRFCHQPAAPIVIVCTANDW